MEDINDAGDDSDVSPQVKMSLPVLLTILLILPLAAGEREVLCAGKEFRLPVYSTSRTVTFTPDSGEPKRVLLENTSVKDPRFKLTKGRMLVLREVTESDQGLYSIKLLSGFTYEILQLKVLDCIASYQRYYGENFEQNIPENAALLEFSPLGAPAEAMPVVLWNRTDTEAGNAGRGRLEQGGEVWVAERVSQVDQGNYTVRNVNGNVLSYSRLTVRAHSFNFTRLIKQSMSLPLPVSHGNLIFIPTQYPKTTSLDESDPGPYYGPVQLIREGKITDSDLRYKGLISFRVDGSKKEVVIVSLTPGHSGVYEIRDKDGNLVSSTVLQVGEKQNKWKSFYNSISASSGVIVAMTGFILFVKRYPASTIAQLRARFRRRRKPVVNPPRVNIHGPVKVDTPKAQNQELKRLTASDSSVPEYCLHSSEDCIQFPVKKDTSKGKTGQITRLLLCTPIGHEHLRLQQCLHI
ncbi:hypothetical protein fugu_013323 [Takifugu bimaculatus]|uniref:Immunoglobulin subtype domain-containing protein n=1 Tax=Takifugu bimaculatus TaxID=433685 RepID=A0A4Z2C2W7_9TELE|nr:hypothetical protein fugu_013323 [Takifugu bimaculatus]